VRHSVTVETKLLGAFQRPLGRLALDELRLLLSCGHA
jgi:hypothetical protein